MKTIHDYHPAEIDLLDIVVSITGPARPSPRAKHKKLPVKNRRVRLAIHGRQLTTEERIEKFLVRQIWKVTTRLFEQSNQRAKEDSCSI